jgi:dienelactone hydrolase
MAALGAMAGAQLKPLDHSVYDSWKNISQRILTPDGRWAAIAVSPQEGDNTVTVRRLDGTESYTFPRGTGMRFTDNSRYLLATQVPEFIAARQARRDRKPAAEQPKNSLLIMNLADGKVTTIEKVQSWSAAPREQEWLVYRPEPAPPARPAPAPAAPARPDIPLAEDQERKPEEPKKKADHVVGNLHVLRNIATGAEIKLENASGFLFSMKGRQLLVSTSTKDGAGDGIDLYDLTQAEPKAQSLVKGLGRYPRMIFTEDGSQAAFVTDKDDYAAKAPSLAVYHWSKKGGLNRAAMKGVPEGWQVAPQGIFNFSKSGRHLLIPTRPAPAEEPPAVPEDEKVNLDVWNWKDRTLQLVQLRQVETERNRSYEARLDLQTGTLVQVENLERRSVSIPNNNDASYGLVISSEPYMREVSWAEGRIDVGLLDLETGSERQVIEGLYGMVAPSPSGKWIIGFDEKALTVFSVNPATGERKNISRGLTRVFDELEDVPALPSPYGIAGWLDGENRVLVNDRFDIWSVDPSGEAEPVNITLGMGRALSASFRVVDLDPDKDTFSATESLIFAYSSERTKESGYWSGNASGRTRPVELIGGAKTVAGLSKATEADRILFTQQRFDVFPDVWTSKLDFVNPQRLTDANPQQKEYLWGTAELMRFTSNDGEDLDAVLIKPGGFDPSKQYPMVVYFYERESDRLHFYSSPSPSASVINPAFFASNGYVVLIPDISYKEGYPGESAMSAILPATQKALGMGFVDPKRIGLQGQSWGGYQTAYLITETNMFAAACAGAPVSNMISAYGGIRYGSGLVRQMQYEIGQSRIGKNLWDAPMRYYENSPIFFLDKVRTPLLVMSNDQDGAVPWTEGIQLFTGLRRLNRPAWMLVYNGEDHNLIQRKNRKDFTVRLSQFFDHYLKGAPMPVWMSEGIPAVNKGRTMGLELKPPR